MKTKIVTWAAPDGAKINISIAQQDRMTAARVWPKNAEGREYCQVHMGQHFGEATLLDTEIDALIAEVTRT